MWQYLTDEHPNQGYNRIDSVQNGILLNNTLHAYWDCWAMSINPVLSLLAISLLTHEKATMRLWFFLDCMERQLYHGNIIQLTESPTLPASPREILYEHFRQAVLANMKGAGEIPSLDYDPTGDSQSMSTFEHGTGKMYFETFMLEKLATQDRDRANDTVQEGHESVSVG